MRYNVDNVMTIKCIWENKLPINIGELILIKWWNSVIWIFSKQTENG